MKKIMVLLFVITLLGTVSAYAAENKFATGGEITIGANDGANDLVVGMSPKVTAKYVNPGTSDSTAQWYSIATAHPGGNVIYGTAQNLNNLYTKSFDTGTALTTTLLDIPTSATSASDWSTNGWSM